MTPSPDSIIDVSKAIQLALAPVFLLTGISGILNVISGRLARIIDRGRKLTEGPGADVQSNREQLRLELQILERRRHYASIAITACTVAALLLCTVIFTLFLEVVLDVPLRLVIGALFAASTLALVVGLAYFLREVHFAMQTIHLDIADDE
jgi:hypothetical protein